MRIQIINATSLHHAGNVAVSPLVWFRLMTTTVDILEAGVNPPK